MYDPPATPSARSSARTTWSHIAHDDPPRDAHRPQLSADYVADFSARVVAPSRILELRREDFDAVRAGAFERLPAAPALDSCTREALLARASADADARTGQRTRNA